MPAEQDHGAVAAAGPIRARPSIVPRPRLSTRSRTARLVAAALASAPEPAFVFAVVLAHAAFISRAGVPGNLAAQTGQSGGFPIDLQGHGPDKRGPFRCRTTLYIKEVRIECRLSPEGCPSG